jgi:hypothetical protein
MSKKMSLEGSNYRKVESCETCSHIYYAAYGPSKQVGSWCDKHQTLVNKKCICDDHALR